MRLLATCTQERPQVPVVAHVFARLACSTWNLVVLSVHFLMSSGGLILLVMFFPFFFSCAVSLLDSLIGFPVEILL